jgi:type IV pilus biogenesis protein CpaD/CtpE
LRADFGESVRANTAMQTINPTAGQEDVPVATRDGERTESIIKAYRKDTGKADASRLVTDLSQ